MQMSLRLGILFFGLILQVSANAKSPNLLIIQTDEHNFRTLSSYRKLMPQEQAEVWGKGVGVNTPHIDSIANDGAIAMNFYASSPVCTPSRASFITGLRPSATGAHRNGLKLDPSVNTFAKILKENGYATSYVGKWHLDGVEKKYKFGIKYKAGFEDNRYMMTGGHAPYFRESDEGLVAVQVKKSFTLAQSELIHLTDYFTDKTLEILQRDKDKPFAVMLSIPDPHTPDHAKPPYHTMFKDLNPIPPKTMDAKLVAQKPSWAKGGKNEAKGFDAEALKQYFGMIKHIDDSVGRLLDFLDKNDLTDNTIVVFTSDHGDMYFEHNRKNKSVPYEAAARIPFLIRFSTKIPKQKVINKTYTTVDFTPTLLGLMGFKSSTLFHGLDASEDFLSSKLVINDDRQTYFMQSSGAWVAAITRKYKLILATNEQPWLFDLEKNPQETINQYGNEAYRDIANSMTTELFKQMKHFEEPVLVRKKPFKI